MKVAINSYYGGFDLSKEALARYEELGGVGFQRNDPILIQVIEELGEDANGDFAELKIVEIPDDVEWFIEEYDGMEWVAEKHRTWR
jgi:hypothetical protein